MFKIFSFNGLFQEQNVIKGKNATWEPLDLKATSMASGFSKYLRKHWWPLRETKTCASQEQNQGKHPNYECFKWKVAESHHKALVELRIC